MRIKFDNTVLLILLIFFFLICLSFKTVFALSIDAISSDVLLITYILSQEPYKIPQPLLLAIYEQESSGGKNLGVNMGSREENIKRCTAMCNPSSDFCLRTYSDEYTKYYKCACKIYCSCCPEARSYKQSCQQKQSNVCNYKNSCGRQAWCTYQQDILEEICQEVGENSNKVPIACDYGMGATQFQPTTWREYPELKGKSPWQESDVIFATGIKLYKDGVLQNKEEAIEKYNTDSEYLSDVLKKEKKWKQELVLKQREILIKIIKELERRIGEQQVIEKIKTQQGKEILEEKPEEEIKKELEKQILEKQEEIPEKSLLEKIKDIPQNISESVSNFFEEKKQQVENAINGQIEKTKKKVEKKVEEIALETQKRIEREIEKQVEKQVKEFEKEMERACAIKTVYGESPELIVLRDFRDKFLLKNNLGKRFVNFYYYHFSPPIAQFLSDKVFLKGVTREVISEPIVYTMRVTQRVWDKN